MNFLTNLLGIFGGGFNSIFGLVTSTMKEGFQAAIRFHKEGIAFARDMGMSAKQAQAYTDVLIQRTQVLANKYGVSAEAILQVQRNLSEATGKQLMLNDAQAEGFVQINKLVGAQTASKFTEEIMNGMGGQIDTVQGAISKVYATAAKQGLNAKKLTDKVAQNLGMANRLSFRNGINGLTRMAALSEKLGINMASVESAAGQFMDLDKAIENAAQMQMLGGSAAANFGNPLTAAYEANYDPEAFAQRLSDSLGSYATFDASKGVSNINGMNMDFVRNIAKTMGISVEEASKMAKKQAEVRYKENALGGTLDRVAGGDEARRNYILNNAQVTNNGKDLEIHGKNINEITEKEWEDMMHFEGMTDKEIMAEQAQTLTSIDEHISGAADSVIAAFAKGIDQYLPEIGKKIQGLGDFFQGFAEQWGADTGKVVGKAMYWLSENGETIANVANSILTGITKLISLAAEYTKTAIGIFLGWKFSKWLLSGSMSSMGGGIGGAAKGVARGIGNAAKTGGRAIKSIWKGPLQTIKRAFSEVKTAKNGLFGSMYRGQRSVGVSRFKALRNTIRGTGGLGQFKNTLKLAKSGGIGIAGALGNVAVDSLVKSGKIKKGGVRHYAGKMASTAAEYAAFGSLIGPIGTGIGAAVGAVKGAYDTWKSLPENADKDFVDYAKSVGEGIVEGGKAAFEWAKDKLSGPASKAKEAFSFIGKEIQERGGFLTVAFKAITAPVRLFVNTLEGVAKLILHPIDTVKGIWSSFTNWLSSDNILGKLLNKAANALFGEKHAEGGIIGVSSKQSIEKHDVGGIIGGNSYSGDNILGLISNGGIGAFNSGEMVVPMKEQGYLFDFIKKTLPQVVNNMNTTNNNFASSSLLSQTVNNGGVSTYSVNNINRANTQNSVITSMMPSSTIYGDTTNSYMNNVTSVLPKTAQVKSKPVIGENAEYIYKPNGSETSTVNGNTITVKDFNINLSGTLRLDGGNVSKNIDMNALLNDYQFMNALKEMIKTSINNDMNGGRFMNDLAARRGQVSSFSIIGR